MRFLPRRDFADEPKPQSNAELYGTDSQGSRLSRQSVIENSRRGKARLAPIIMIVVRLLQIASTLSGQAFEETLAFQFVDNTFVEVFADIHVDFHGGIALRDDFQSIA